MKDVEECYPLLIAGYSHQIHIYQEPAFARCVPHVTKKKNVIISKVKSKYWTLNHKYRVMIPKSVKEAISLDKPNGNIILW